MTDETQTLRETLFNERQYAGHEMSTVRALHKIILRDKIAPLLSDAVDALEIDNPEPGIALRRLKAALSVIDISLA